MVVDRRGHLERSLARNTSHDLVYLASRAGACTTGTILAVDGGITGCGPK